VEELTGKKKSMHVTAFKSVIDETKQWMHACAEAGGRAQARAATEEYAQTLWGSPTWFIYKQERGGGGLMGVGGGDPTFAVVGRSQKRPTVADLEDAFYNASAAASPVTKGVAALKGLVDRARGKE
jgi:hypothetical protein